MKRKLKRCLILLLILCAVSYGYYIYYINSDNSSNNTYGNSSIQKEKNDNKQENIIKINNSTKLKNDMVETDQQNNDFSNSEVNINNLNKNESSSNESSNNESNSNMSNNIDSNNTAEDNVPKVVQSKLDIYATSALLMDASNDRVLYEKNGYNVMPMASTTKIMTLIVTLENANLEDVVTVSKNAAKMPDVQLNINSGEKYKLGDLVYSLMLESHNDVAVALAEHVGGSVEGFAVMMNTKAKELGCENTNFVTPNGLDAENHHTTAVDLAKIAAYAIKNEKFLQITNTTSYTFSEVTGKRTFSVNNKDAFLNLMDGAIGVKTGFTGKAGYCFVGALKRDNKTFVSVVLACGWPPNKSYKWHDTKILMNYGLNNYSMSQINEDKKLDPIKVVDGQISWASIKAEEKEIKLLLKKDDSTRVEYDIPEYLTAPVKENDLIGGVKYYVNDILYEETPIYTTSGVKQIDYRYCIEKIVHIWSLQ